MYKKLLLCSAITAALGTSGMAQAAVDLDDTTANPLTFAEEIAIGGGVNLDVTAAGSNGGGSSNPSTVAVEAAFGFTIGDGTSKYVRLTFDEPLGAALEPGDFSDDSAATATYSISQAGQAGDTYVIVEIAATGGDVLATDHFQFAPQTGDEINATSMTDRNLAFRLFETAVDAVNETNVLVNKSGQWISWGPGYEVACTAGSPSRIDVVSPANFLDANATQTVATASVTALTVFTEGGTVVTIPADYFSPGSTVTIAGSTAGFTAANGFELSGASADAAPASGEASWTTTAIDGTAVELPFANGGAFVVNANGTDEMVPSEYTFSVTDGGGASYDVGTVSTSCGNLQYSGSTDRLDFALTPGGHYKQFARITNPSATAGDVTVTVYNDLGDSVTFPLADVDGVATSNLEAHGSTRLMNVEAIWDAATTADPSLELGTSGRDKLRVEVRGEFGDDALEGETGGDRLVDRRVDGIYIQGLTVSNDGQSFFQTK